MVLRVYASALPVALQASPRSVGAGQRRLDEVLGEVLVAGEQVGRAQAAPGFGHGRTSRTRGSTWAFLQGRWDISTGVTPQTSVALRKVAGGTRRIDRSTVHRRGAYGAGVLMRMSTLCFCGPCARIRPRRRCRATGCCCGPATSAVPHRAATPGCRWASWCSTGSPRSSARRWPRSAARRCLSRRCCRASPTRRPAGGPSTATTSSPLTDRRGADYLLAPTHEEMFTLLVKDLYALVQGLPGDPLQVQTKFRDEARPRAGLLRGREFLMKDAYSFDLDDAGLRASYAAAPRRVPADLRPAWAWTTRWCTAMSGAMGGSASEEFLATTAGRRGHLRRLHHLRLRGEHRGGGHAGAGGRPTRARSRPSTAHDTPDTPTIESLVELANARRLGGRDRLDRRRHAQERRVVTLTTPGRERAELLVIGRARRPGGRPEAGRGGAAPGDSVTMFDDFAAQPELVRGYIGPQVLAKLGIRYLVDPRVVAGTAWLTGANEPGRHATDVVCGRDFTPGRHDRGGRGARRRPVPGLRRRAQLTIRRGIEIGHIFQLGRRYTDAFGVDALGAGRQAGPADHGLLRHRRLPGGRRDRRAAPRRARAGLAGRRRPVRRTPGRCREGRPGRRRRSSSAGGWPPPACGCLSTTARTSRPG